jgi:hypothetical protein
MTQAINQMVGKAREVFMPDDATDGTGPRDQ